MTQNKGQANASVAAAVTISEFLEASVTKKPFDTEENQ